MCGIVAYIGHQAAYPIILKGLKRLEYRGYDSAGIALQNGTLSVYKKKGKVALQPLGDKVVVARDESLGTTAGGIFLPDSAKDKPSRGTIIAIGTGKLLDDGSRGEMQVKKGDRVLFTSYAPETIKLDDEEYLLMSESDILAVIE